MRYSHVALVFVFLYITSGGWNDSNDFPLLKSEMEGNGGGSVGRSHGPERDNERGTGGRLKRKAKNPESIDQSKPGGPIERPAEWDAYQPIYHPILDQSRFPPDKNNPMQVRLFTGNRSRITGPSEFLADGVERSLYLKLLSVSFAARKSQVEYMHVNKAIPNQPVLWIVDFASMNQDCHCLEMLVIHGHEMDKNASHRQLFIADYTGSWEIVRCDLVEEDLGKANVRVARRGIVRDRYWNRTKDWVERGQVVSFTDAIFAPLALRESFVETLPMALEARSKKGMLPFAKSKNLVPYETRRTNDVAQFWRKGDSSHHGFLRRKIGDIVSSMQGISLGKRRIRTLLHAFDDCRSSMNQISPNYVYQMMRTKAIVVAQRDEWEDHYRLLESLAAGALVFTDRMLSLPEGLVDGENIIVYDSEEMLKRLIEHYLDPKRDELRFTIARKGWEVAMGRHRGWHRVESLLFGKPLTRVDQPYEPAPPRKLRANFGNIERDV